MAAAGGPDEHVPGRSLWHQAMDVSAKKKAPVLPGPFMLSDAEERLT